MWCVIPAAGRGTRMEGLTDGRPKALLEISGRTLIEHLLDRLRGPVTDVCLVTGPGEAESFRRILGESYGDLCVHIAVQNSPVGVADAVRRAEALVNGPFMVVMGDCWYDRDLSSFPQQWQSADTDGAVLVEPADVAGGQPIGLVTLTEERVTGMIKAPWSGQADLRVCGAFLFPLKFFTSAAAAHRPESGEHELEDVVQELIAGGATFRAIRYEGWRRNINTPADLRAVEERVDTLSDPAAINASE